MEDKATELTNFFLSIILFGNYYLICFYCLIPLLERSCFLEEFTEKIRKHIKISHVAVILTSFIFSIHIVFGFLPTICVRIILGIYFSFLEIYGHQY